MNVNFSQAGRRHFADCRPLAGLHRAGNASHLAGVAAECALKAILQGLGLLTLDIKGMPEDRKHRHHIDKIWNEFQTALSGRRAAKYALDGGNPFDDWRIDHRYEADSTIVLSIAERHRSGADRALLLLESAQLEGDVP